MGYNSRFRKKLFVDPVVQGAILRRLAIHWAYAMLAAFLCLLMVQVFTDGVNKPLTSHLAAMWERYGILFITMICIIPAFAYDSVKLSHRFVGPMIAVRMCLRKMADGGDIPEITFRKGDFWTDIAVDLNRIAMRLRGQGPQPTTAANEEETVDLGMH